MSAPHRCPLCAGEGKVVDARVRDFVDCRACKGTGVVWEPVGEPQEAAAAAGKDPQQIDGL
jgi:DnaJ-class molecular chaperone